MAENTKNLLDKRPDDALGEGAARLERLIENVKRQQATPVESTRAAPSNPLLSESPGEEWARRFQTQIIGPEAKSLTAAEFAPVPKGLVLPRTATESLVVPRVAEIAPKLAVAAPELGFGRPQKPRRSWFARLLLGR